MQISDYVDAINNTIKVSFIVLACMLGLVWLNQPSLNQYWTLHFHQESPWSSVSLPVWKQGAEVRRAAEAAKLAFVVQLSGSSVESAIPFVEEIPLLQKHQSVSPAQVDIVSGGPQNILQLSRWITAQRQADGMKSGQQPTSPVFTLLYDEQGAAFLPEGKQVLFIGDSMMEGVAPRVLSLLKSSYQAKGINLSKRSTGLAYPGFFNWPETTASALKSNSDIGLLAVFLGPNDPWDMPSGKGRPYLKFGSEEWAVEYRSRIRQILSLAEKYSIPVIWVLPPNMRKDKLNRGMTILAALYESEVVAMGGSVIRVNDLFGYQGEEYSATAMINEKRVNVRSGDGIHYTPAGAGIIAKAIMEKIHFIPQGSESIHDE